MSIISIIFTSAWPLNGYATGGEITMGCKIRKLFFTVALLVSGAVYSDGAIAQACKLALTSEAFSFNTCIGTEVLSNNISGGFNSALGFRALFSNTTGSYNSALGINALYFNTTGINNVSIGVSSLVYNTTGNNNSALGTYSLYSNTIGYENSAMGFSAIGANTSGKNNSAVGYNALRNNTTGANNTAIGHSAGYNLTTGSNNVDIANIGVAGESAAIRIGTQGVHASAYLAGVYGVNVPNASFVTVTPSGQLGIYVSSRRYKEDIKPMDSVSDKLLELRPVTFRYKKADEEGRKPIQYGLIAEEVDEIMPELVVRNKDGSPETVAYQYIPSLLLNEYQKQHRELITQKAALSEIKAVLASSETKETISAQQINELKSQHKIDLQKIADLQAQIDKLNAITKKLIASLSASARTAMLK